MAKHSIPMENISRLKVVSVGGNLFLSGWNQEEIRIKDLENEDQIKTKKDLVEIQIPGDGFIQIPHHLEVEIMSVSGDAVIKGLSSDLQIKSVSGDLTLSDTNTTSAGSISGDLLAKRVQGDIKIETISGDALVENIQGQISLRQVSGDIVLVDVGGGIEVSASGEGTIDFHPVPWQAYKVNVDGNLSVSLPVECNADLVIKSDDRDISLTLGDLDIKSQEEELTHQVGEGGPTVILSAGGKIFVSGDDFSVFSGIKMNMEDLGTFATDFSAHTADQIKNSLENLEFDLQDSLSGLSETFEELGLSEENMKVFGIQIEETSKMAAEKAELAAIRAQAKVEKKIASARKKALKAQAKVKQFDLGEFLEMQSEKKAVNESERLLILEMLQEKKISLDEADELLNALEGKK